MKQVMWLVVIATVVLVALPAWTACPVHPTPGLYATTNGTILPGRASEAWCAGLGPGVPGNIENGMSWDATAGALGSQWHVWDMTIDASGAQEVSRHLDTHGNGWIDYVTNYTGGQFWLTKNHTWSDGVNDLTGQLTYYNVSARVT
jgi:hypothetical protein